MENTPAAVATHVMPGSGVRKRRHTSGKLAKIVARQLNQGARSTEQLVEELMVTRMIRETISAKADHLNNGRPIHVGRGTVDLVRALIESIVGRLFADGARLIRLHVPAHVEISGRHIQFLIQQKKAPSPLL
jgi:urease gamma subunit